MAGLVYTRVKVNQLTVAHTQTKTTQLRRVEQFCRAVDGWMQERTALNQQLERSLADCVCSSTG